MWRRLLIGCIAGWQPTFVKTTVMSLRIAMVSRLFLSDLPAPYH